MAKWVTEMSGIFPNYSKRERVADGCIHIVGVTASVIALAALLFIGAKAQTPLWIAALVIYGLALVSMFSCSAGYHLISRPLPKEIFRRLDHASIFLLIAGTYTPFVLIKMNNPWGLGLLAFVWGMAVVGIAIKLFAPRFLEGLSTAIYLMQGWAVLAAIEPLSTALPGQVLTMLMVGGVLYTVGVVFHLWDRLPYQNAIWHGFVLTAASVHYAAVVSIAAST
jgi:hemolysin III